MNGVSEPAGDTAAPVFVPVPGPAAVTPANGDANGAATTAFSWLDPHPTFVIVLVGPDEEPFGLQKDFLCAKSSFYRQSFARQNGAQIEHIVKLSDTPVEVFAFAQNFMFTGNVVASGMSVPTYDVLIGVWKLGNDLGIEGLCDKTLEAMNEVRRITDRIPSTPLLVQAWKETPEGSTIRKLLLEWAAEYMRSSDSRQEFARSLPQEVLSELVVAMSALDTSPLVQLNSYFGVPSTSHSPQRKAVHYIEEESETEQPAAPMVKKQRRSDIQSKESAAKAASRKARASMPTTKAVPRRRSAAAVAADQDFSTDQKLNFCADLLTRMLSGPGFWTRLVGPFKEPVDPNVDSVPDYFEKIAKPMDLSTMKRKMDAKEYTSHEEFLADMDLMFNNCYTYWKATDPMYHSCEKLEKTFQEKYSQMNKWIAKMRGNEDH